MHCTVFELNKHFGPWKSPTTEIPPLRSTTPQQFAAQAVIGGWFEGNWRACEISTGDFYCLGPDGKPRTREEFISALLATAKE